MIIDLPYEIGTKVKCIKDGRERFVMQYIIQNHNKNIFVSLDFCGRWATRLPIEEFMNEWKEC